MVTRLSTIYASKIRNPRRQRKPSGTSTLQKKKWIAPLPNIDGVCQSPRTIRQ